MVRSDIKLTVDGNTRMGAGRQRLMRKARDVPLTQGDLDGLCGVYAIINAVRYLYPCIGARECERLFNSLMKVLRKHDAGRLSIANKGLHFQQVLDLTLAVRHDINKWLGIELRVSRPRNMPRRASLEVVWGLLTKRLNENCVAILGLHGRHDHWTLATSATDNLIRLADSDGLKVLRRANCRADASKRHVCLSQREVIFLSRTNGSRRRW